jgi:hypothetical protein
MALSHICCVPNDWYAGCRYSKGELEGKNVNCLMPQPFSMRHNSYLNNYITTGHAKLLDTTREVGPAAAGVGNRCSLSTGQQHTQSHNTCAQRSLKHWRH